MRTRKMRLLSALLAVAMMFVMMPMGAFAEDTDPMGALIPNNYGSVYEINTPGTYQMSGTYDAPIDVNCGGVTINITGNTIYTGASNSTTEWAKNYAIRVINDSGVVTINNNGHTVTLQGDGSTDNTRRLGFVRVDGHENGKASSVTVTGGSYQIENMGNVKEIFYNYQANLTIDNVTAEGEIALKNNGGKTVVNNSIFKRIQKTDTYQRNQGAIINSADGALTLKDVEVSAVQGSALLTLGGKITITGGAFSTEDDSYSTILANTTRGDAGEGIGDGISQITAEVTLNGTTIKNSDHALEAKDGKFILKDATFENNESDICLNEDQKLDDVVDTTDYNGKPLTAKVTDSNGNTTMDVVKPATLTVEGGKVTVDAASIGDEAIETTVNDKTTTVKLPVGAVVTVAFDETTYADSNLEFGYWDIKGLANAETYKGKKEFTFEVPNSDVTIKAMTSTEPSDDSLDAATVITGVAIGAGAAVLTYHIGTELYAEQVLGKGVSIPKTRTDVALKAWELAGKPTVELNGEPLSEAAQAEKWAVESGLMQNDAEGNFNGAKKMNKLKALRVLDKAQKLG